MGPGFSKKSRIRYSYNCNNGNSNSVNKAQKVRLLDAWNSTRCYDSAPAGNGHTAHEIDNRYRPNRHFFRERREEDRGLDIFGLV